MANIMLKCKHCQKAFSSGISGSLKNLKLSNNTHQCPHCGKSAAYNQPDYYEDPQN